MFVILAFIVNFYLGNVNTQIAYITHLSPSSIVLYAKYFTIIMTCGAFFIPVVGWMLDTWGFSVTALCVSLSGMCFGSMFFIYSPDALIPTFILYTCFRTSLFTFIFSYLVWALVFLFSCSIYLSIYLFFVFFTCFLFFSLFFFLWLIYRLKHLVSSFMAFYVDLCLQWLLQ